MVNPPVAYAFPLATFHVCVLALAFIAVSYPGLGGIADLNAALGLVAFALLWAVTYDGTRWALADVRIHAIEVAMYRGIGGGARSGALLVLFGVLPALVLASIADPLAALFVLGLYGSIGLLIAAIVGGAIGFVFSLIDWAILTMAGVGDGWDPQREEVNDA